MPDHDYNYGIFKYLNHVVMFLQSHQLIQQHWNAMDRESNGLVSSVKSCKISCFQVLYPPRENQKHFII